MNLVAFLVESINLGLISKSADLAPDLTLGKGQGQNLSLSQLEGRWREVGEIPHGEIKQHEGKHDCRARSRAAAAAKRASVEGSREPARARWSFYEAALTKYEYASDQLL